MPSLSPSLPPSLPIDVGYTKNHAQYKEQHNVWHHKSSRMKEEVSIKVFLGHVPSGK
jgi:hypothetical protein